VDGARQWRWVYSKPCQTTPEGRNCSHMYITVPLLVCFFLSEQVLVVVVRLHMCEQFT
jgi:hypothetical protein